MKLPSNTSESSGTDGWILETYKWERNGKEKRILRKEIYASLSLDYYCPNYIKLLFISIYSLFRQLANIIWGSSMC